MEPSPGSRTEPRKVPTDAAEPERGSLGPRRVHCVLSPRSLDYAEACLGSLLRNSLDALDLCLITDSDADRERLRSVFEAPSARHGHRLRVLAKSDLDRAAERMFAGRPHLARFRDGHPCWRKITDPVLAATPGDEVIVIDPDVYFPNRFRFEPTPTCGLYLMHQGPNCLLPEALVRQAFDRGIAMADHTDIGVCQFRMPLPLDELEALLVAVDTAPYAWCMHVESVVWAALLAKMGGGYLAPGTWLCFANTLSGRVARRLGRSGVDTLKGLPMGSVKAFHAGGVAKHWLRAAEEAGVFGRPGRVDAGTPFTPVRPYRRAKFEFLHGLRRLARKARIYELLTAS